MKIRSNPKFPVELTQLSRELGVLWRELATEVNRLIDNADTGGHWHGGNGDLQTIWVHAGAMTPTTTLGAVASSAETSTNKIMVSGLDFADGAALSHAQFQVKMPKSWDAGTVTATFTWTANSTSTNSVVWGIKAVSIADDGALDSSFGTAVTVTDANKSTAYDTNISAETSAITIAGAGKSEYCVFDVYRDPTNGSDTLAATAILLGVSIFYNTDSGSDE